MCFQYAPSPLEAHSQNRLWASLLCLPLVCRCSDCPCAALLHVGEPVQAHALFRYHVSAVDRKTSTSSLGCSTKRQTLKPSC